MCLFLYLIYVINDKDQGAHKAHAQTRGSIGVRKGLAAARAGRGTGDTRDVTTPRDRRHALRVVSRP
eukprot:scaffold13603_cov112-Isochrysis_galbana.AAC.16